jgi:hypothetical protein
MYLLYTFILSALFFATLSCVKDRLIHSLCSLSWLILMVLPFLMQYNSFHASYRDTQMIGILSIGMAFLLAESLFSYKHRKSLGLEQPLTFNIKVTYAAALVIVAVQILHLLLMPEIPIITYLHNFKNDQSLTILRESASKLLHIPELFKYLFQLTNVIAPALAVILFKKSKRWALPFIAITIFYSFATTAKTMTVLYSAILLIPLYYQLNKIRKLINFSALAFTYCLAIYSFAFYIYTKPASLDYLEVERENARTFTIADRHRIFGLVPFEKHENRSSSAIEARIKGLFYRAILVPSEVSHIWYSYYPAVKGDFIGFYGLTPETRNSESFVHPSNEVGIWAYVKKFPKDYLDSIHAYSSMDAEIYSRFGLSGVFLISLLLFFIVVYLLPTTTNFKTNDAIIFKFSGLLIIALFSSMASLQAMLLAHGLIIIFFIILAVKIRPYLKFI